jgi:tRNA(Glu) U13 pseudouridine synthase TruD
VQQRAFGFAGTKDKRSVSTQQVSFFVFVLADEQIGIN